MLCRNLYDYNCKTYHHYNKFRAGLALIPFLTDPDGVRTVPDSLPHIGHKFLRVKWPNQQRQSTEGI